MWLTRLLQMTAGAVMAALLGACATTTNVDYRSDYDFSTLHSFRLVPPATPGSSDTRINSPLVEARIAHAIRDHLAAQGYTVTDGDADANLTWQLTTHAGLESADTGFSVGIGTFSRHSMLGFGYGFPGYDVNSYDEGVLTIDMLRTGDDTLLWRGSDSRRLADGATPDSLTDMINDLVDRILRKFPPH
ncbi:MAG: DUF4136 domain-containing protein [Pseudomonadota bacterium]